MIAHKIRRGISRVKEWMRMHPFEVFVTCLYCWLVLFLPLQTFDSFAYNFWAQHIRTVGVSRTYELQSINYMPLSMIAIALWDAGAASIGKSAADISHLIKIYPLFFDWLSVLLLLRIAKSLGRSPWLVLCLTIPNIAWHYNALIWGQFDGVYTFFAVLALYVLIQKRLALGLIAYLFALNAKLQAIIYFPLILLAGGFLLLHWREQLPPVGRGKYVLKKMTQVIFAGVLLVWIQQLLMLPFFMVAPAQILTNVWHGSISLMTYVTVNADNFWVLVGVRAFTVHDFETWLFGIPYRSWGHGLLTIFSLLACAPLTVIFIEAVRRRKRVILESPQMLRMFVIAGYQLSLIFFFFLTQMHERYSHPTLFFSILLLLLGGSPLLVVVTCLAYVINLERVMMFWPVTLEIGAMYRLDSGAAALFAIAFLLSWYELWKVRHFFLPKLPLAKPASS